MVANDNCSACEFQNGLASSRRYDENRLERNRKPLGRRVQHSNGWRGGSEPNLFKHVGLEAREIPAVGEVFSLDFPLYRTWGWKQEKFQRWGKCFLLTSPSIEHPPRRKRRGFLRPLGLFFPRWLRWVPPTTALLQRRTTKRLYFGLSAHRSFTREHFGVATFKKTRGPYIPGFKSRGFTALKGNAFPPYASKVVSDVPSLYAHNQARQTSELLAGRGVDHGAFAPGPQYPLGCSV